MPKKITVRVLLLLVAAFGVFIAYSVVSVFIPRQGTAARISDLQAVYAKAGPRIASTFTNSLIQKFPFDGPINWKLIFFKDTAVFLYGKVETNGLHQFISSHPDTRFLWMGDSNECEEGWPRTNKCWPATTIWTNVWFNTGWDVPGSPTSIDGRVDLRSGTVAFRVW